MFSYVINNRLFSSKLLNNDDVKMHIQYIIDDVLHFFSIIFFVTFSSLFFTLYVILKFIVYFILFYTLQYSNIFSKMIDFFKFCEEIKASHFKMLIACCLFCETKNLKYNKTFIINKKDFINLNLKKKFEFDSIFVFFIRMLLLRVLFSLLSSFIVRCFCSFLSRLDLQQ